MISRDSYREGSVRSVAGATEIGAGQGEARPVLPGRLSAHISALAACILVWFVMIPQSSEAEDAMPAVTREQASGFARLALKGLGKEYPNKLEHVMAGPDDVKSPQALHPAFYGSYDWHSSVHGHWMLAR